MPGTNKNTAVVLPQEFHQPCELHMVKDNREKTLKAEEHIDALVKLGWDMETDIVDWLLSLSD